MDRYFDLSFSDAERSHATGAKSTIVPSSPSNTISLAPEAVPFSPANDIYSCKTCQKKKVACSKEMPCAYCAKRNLECIYEKQKSQLVLGIKREREVILKGCDRCLEIMLTNKKINCDLMSPCYDCMKLGLDCTYERYKKNSMDGSTNQTRNDGILKRYILEEFTNEGDEKDIEYLEMLQENEMFLESRDENNDDDIEVLQLFQDYSYWIMQKSFYTGLVLSTQGFVIENSKSNQEIFDLNDFITIKVLTTYAIENLGFMFLGLFYDPLKSIAEKPDLFIRKAQENSTFATIDNLLDECVLRSIAILSLHYMSDSVFYGLTEISSSKKIAFSKAHLDHVLDLLTKISHFEDIRIVQVILVLSSTDLPIRYSKKYSCLISRAFDLIKTLNLDKISSVIDDATLLKFTFIQKNIYYKYIYFTHLYQNIISQNQAAVMSEKHDYDFRRIHINGDFDSDPAEEDTRISFEFLQYKVGLFLKELHDKEMVVYPRGLIRYFSNLQRKLKHFKRKNINQLLKEENNYSISTKGESLLMKIDYYFLNWKIIKYKFTNSEKNSLKTTMVLVDDIFSACELIIECLLDCLNEDSITYRFYRYPSIMNCVVQITTFHALYRIFNKSERNVLIYEKLVMIIHKFIELELSEEDDESVESVNFDNNIFVSKYILLTRLLDRFNSIKGLFIRNEINNKSITQNLPFIILKEDVISIKSNYEDRVANIIPGMNTTVRNDNHAYNSRWDLKEKIDLITDYRENLYEILASFKDFI